MIQTLLIVLYALASISFGFESDLNFADFETSRAYIRDVGLKKKSEEIRGDLSTYRSEKDIDFKNSLNDYKKSLGTEQLYYFSNPWENFAATPSGGLVRSRSFNFSRAVVYEKNVSKEDGASFLSKNGCGNGAFNDRNTLVWCSPSKKEKAIVIDARETYLNYLSEEKKRQAVFIHKVRAYLTKFNGLPAGVTPNNEVSLTSLVGYSGSYYNCSGTFLLGVIPVSCEDMFEVRGSKSFILANAAGNSIIMKTYSSLVYANGKPVIIFSHPS